MDKRKHSGVSVKDIPLLVENKNGLLVVPKASITIDVAAKRVLKYKFTDCRNVSRNAMRKELTDFVSSFGYTL